MKSPENSQFSAVSPSENRKSLRAETLLGCQMGGLGAHEGGEDDALCKATFSFKSRNEKPTDHGDNL